ncbi:CDP-glucose 4,6-dehydratase [Sedimentibacter sp. zth1]|uniref:CDP-glucose 4,6-dehydratase n=1 Tax=Sedimentibacter sp. zth1 TaxID=2816908 RepID=UPI001A90F7EB|nr:CDP-glucose 4,6-dehydratase [Sedimentibacter sp. zth1]QSX07154.1 CDP-glucose 4,6-dehydratase [Sedimentibacter sp. zth1]
MINQGFWKNKNVFITGHTGFKGSWLSFWLIMMGAKVSGYALKPNSQPSLFEILKLNDKVNSNIGDINDLKELNKVVKMVKPDIVFHMAAQPIVRESYNDPIYTFNTNIMGTANLFESIRDIENVKAIVNITTDKVYKNNEWDWPYREIDVLGGNDPYSCSKACSELITNSYRESFYKEKYNTLIATARAGNVIGGGDWASDRIIPDCIRAFKNDTPVIIRNKFSIRPWQHVLEPLSGYLVLAQKLYEGNKLCAESFNFGPNIEDCISVEKVVGMACKYWGENAKFVCLEVQNGPNESKLLKLDSSKTINKLGVTPKWNVYKSIEETIEWYKCFYANNNIFKFTENQINNFIRG